ncbi:hypothetical protein [Bacillus sp. T3]|uniref:hypothetical protein n=1 Tax=Bacillus sp. T3 TaxID=467262 RepID=UPI002981E803|nr:hypothetical protein [Bacillus sp. T3]
MKVGFILLVTIIILCMFLYEWPKMQRKQGKEKKIFLLLLITGWILATILLFFPTIPGPTQLVAYLFKPWSKYLS